MKAFFKSINLLNLGFFIGCIILGLNLAPMLDYKPDISVKPDNSEAENVHEQDVAEKTEQARDVVEYGIIPEKNLFHPERKVVVAAVETPPPPPPPPPPLETPDLVLYGTVISSNLRIAYIEEKNKKRPAQPQPNSQPQVQPEKEQRVFQLGDAISGFTLKEINEDSVVLYRGEEKLEVQVFDPADPKKRTPPPVTMAAPPPIDTQQQQIQKPPPRISPTVTQQQPEQQRQESLMRRRRMLDRRSQR